MNTIILNDSLSIEDAMKIIRFKYKVEFSEEAIKRIKKSRNHIEDAVEKNQQIYGVTTGLGANSNKNVELNDAKNYQLNILKSHAVSVGDTIKEEKVRAIMLMIILNGVKGYSGVSFDTLNIYKEALNNNIYIYTPREGSVGYLSLEAHIALGLCGIGKIKINDKWIDANDALLEKKIKKLNLSYKEALFLISGTTSVTGLGLIAFYDLNNAEVNAEIISAMSIEVNLATTRALDSRLMEVRKQIEQQKIANNISNILEDSEICKEYYDKSLQSSMSLRCIPQLHGPVRKKLNEAKLTIEREMASCTDNPILYENEDGSLDVISGCNPDSSYIGLEMDCLAIGACMIAKMSERRTFRLLDEKLSNKPAFLIKNPGFNSGLMITQYTQAGILNDMKILATPAVIDNIPTCANQEDYVAMGYNSSKKLLKICEYLNYILSIELIAIYEAYSFIDKELARSKVTNEIYNYLSNFIPEMNNDIELYPIIEKIKDELQKEELIKILNKNKKSL